MMVATLILAVVAASLTAHTLWRNRGLALRGWALAVRSVREQLVLLLLAFVVAGYVEVLIPQHIVRQWLGTGAGLKGIIIASVAGGVLPMGPYVVLPILAALRAAGAGLATTVAFAVGWMMWSVGKLPFELALLGPRFAIRRTLLYLAFPPLAGLLAAWLFGG